MRHRLVLAVLCALPLVATGCTTLTREDVYKEDKVEVFLRSESRLFRGVAKGFDHPATISGFRVAHVLSRIDVRHSIEDGNRREPAVPTQMLYSVADGVSKALAKAGPDQEIVVMALRVDKTFGVLREEYLTSFVAYVRGEQLFIHLAKSDQIVRTRRRDERLPQPRVGEESEKVKIFPGTAMTLVGQQVVAVSWRDPIFARPTRTKILPTGEIKRKTILLESPEEVVDEESYADTDWLPPNLSPRQLRELADLEEERAAGAITEANYRSRRRAILEAP